MYKDTVARGRQEQIADDENLFCADLPTRFQPSIGSILVTGASGYIGGRLVPELVARGYKVRVMVRSPGYDTRWPGVEAVMADALDAGQLKTALKDIDIAYYLIHSLHLGPRKFAAADIKAARNFARIAAEMGLKRIIYLGGLGDIRSSLSSHLRSRAEVAVELSRGSVPVTILRAAIIVGSGSASYEIIQHLAMRLQVVLIPWWATNRCQPIAVRDVIKYLVGVLETPETKGRSFDIGGKDILTYETMLKTLARRLRKKSIFIPVPFSNIKFYAYLASLLTPVPISLTECLMESLKNEVVCQDDTIKTLIPFEPLSYKEAVIRAMSREKQDSIYTRWSDAHFPTYEAAVKLGELQKRPAYKVSYSIVTEKGASGLFTSICRVGGRRGWFHSNWLWRLRGLIDRVLLGVGSARGRRSYSTLKINDVIDFWRIEDIQENKRLLLRSEMRLPGNAWLEFNIMEEKDHRHLSVSAYYDTESIFGKIYWYICLPLHHFVFYNLLKAIEKKS